MDVSSFFKRERSEIISFILLSMKSSFDSYELKTILVRIEHKSIRDLYFEFCSVFLLENNMKLLHNMIIYIA